MVNIIDRYREVEKYFVLNKIRGKSYVISFFCVSGFLLNRLLGVNSNVLNTGSVLEGFQLYTRPLLISYSRSGTNWVRYIIEYLSQQPTPGYVRSKSGVNFVIDRAHAGYKNIHNYNKVMLVIRNYKECLVRHDSIEFVNSFATISDYLESDRRLQQPRWYIENIKAFDDFEGKKMLLYYEDLLTDSVTCAKKIANFLGLDNERLAGLIDNIDEHKKRSVELYKNDHDSVTCGDVNKLDYHSKHGLSEEARQAFDQYYRENYPRLFTKYLARYQEELPV